MGGLRFKQLVLKPEETAEYVIIMGIAENEEEAQRLVLSYNSSVKVTQAFERVKTYWQEKVNVRYHTGDRHFDLFLRWVSFSQY